MIDHKAGSFTSKNKKDRNGKDEIFIINKEIGEANPQNSLVIKTNSLKEKKQYIDSLITF